MNPAGLSRREMGVLYLLIAVLLVAFVYKGFYLPFQARLEQAEDQLAVSQKRLYKDLRLIQKARNYEKKNRALLSRFTQSGSDEQVMSGIVSEIEKAAAGPRLRIADMKPQRVRKMDGHNVFSVNLALEGEMVPLLKYIHALQSAPHLFAVDELRLERKALSAGDVKCSVLLSRLLLQP